MKKKAEVLGLGLRFFSGSFRVFFFKFFFGGGDDIILDL